MLLQLKSMSGLIFCAAVLACAIAQCKEGEAPLPPQPPVPMLSPEETLKTFQLPEGYKLEVVLDESVIHEPVICVFDGNGRMYIAEMRSYMQEIDGKNEHTPAGVVSRHESSKGDGVFDKHTIFQDKLVLPRMVLPLDDRIVIGITDTNDLFTYCDKNNDGVADDKVSFFEGGPRGGNLEHQPSGLIWSMDNWIYTAGNAYRMRIENGKTIKDGTASNGGQWGCAQDQHGKVWFSNAGGEQAFVNFQTHIQYAAINVAAAKTKEFMEVWPLVAIPDVQGGTGRFRPTEKTLNHFTASCGHEIFRGDRLPADMYGDAFIAEPVGRLIRRAKVELKDGITYLSNPYEKEKSEFIRSTDPNFRPVNMTTGPDGCLYIVDMYRGIIQEGNWVREGSYLRKVVQQYGLDKNFARGRIYRLVHKDFKPGPQPKMLDETPAQLVAHLEHPNGWWRDTAQKLLVLKGDKSVAPALTQLARTHANYLTRMHALWTLDGLGVLTADLVREKLKDSHPQVRATAIRVSEGMIKKEDKALIPDILAMSTDADPVVVLQELMTAKFLNFPDHQIALKAAAEGHASDGVKEIAKQLLNAGKPEIKEKFSDADMKLFKRGSEIFKELCFGCHGTDGRGMPLAGAAAGVTMAPPLSGSKTLMGHKDAAAYVLLHGMSGPVNEKSYEAQMVAMNSNPDDWIAAAGSYVRNSFGNSGAMIQPIDVKRIREATKSRTTPWTTEELLAMFPKPLTNSKDWVLSASHNAGALKLAIDSKTDTRYETKTAQVPGMWIKIELPEPTLVSGVRLDSSKSANDYPRGYKVELSTDGKDWGKPVVEGKGAGMTEIDFAPAKTKFIRITQTGSAPGLFWSIHEMQIVAPGSSKSAAEVKPAAAPGKS